MPSHIPKRALILIDVQNEYDGGGLPIEYPDVRTSLARIGQAIDAARAAGIPVAAIRQTASPGAPVFAEGSHGWELHEVVRSRGCDVVIDKALPDAFAGTALLPWLQERGIDTLTVAGYMTHNCVDATVRHAMHLGYRVEFLHDAAGSLPYANAVGAASAEQIHRIFCLVMHTRFAAVAATRDWAAALRAGGALERDDIVTSNRRARPAVLAPPARAMRSA